MKKLHKVVVVGRTNVGKSTLFNRLSTNVKSLTLDYVGVTRDFLEDTVTWQGKSFDLVDTGGIQLRKSHDPLMERVRLRALEVLDKASIIMFMVDGTVGLLPEDRAIGSYVHKLGKPTMLLVNKVDAKITKDLAPEFDRLGFEDTLLISAQHGTNTADLLQMIVDRLPKDVSEDTTKAELRVVFLGKPNVGKSSLMNFLLQKERTLVSEIAGTTREAISDKVAFYSETIQVTDTAGVRRKRSVDEGIEEMMVKSSLQAVRDADIVVLLVDGSEGQISHQELRLAQFVFETGKALILVKNKHDLMDDNTVEQWKYDEDVYEHLFKKLEKLTISCKTGHNVGKLMPLIMTVWDRYQFHVSMSEISLLLKTALEKTPLYRNQQKLKLYSVKQITSKPPTFRLNVNEPGWFETSQLGFFENLLRKTYELVGVPIQFVVKRVKPF